MNRRNFLRNSCQFCLAGTAALALAELSACSPAGYKAIRADIVDNQVQVPLSSFDHAPFQVISPRKYSYEIAVHKNADQSYSALLMRCTHMDNQLTVTGNGFYCNLHGSTFDQQGNIKKGPAERKLKELKTAISQSNLVIYL